MNRPDREATGKEIIETIVNAMRDGLEPMFSKTLAPGLFHVYLREPDYERLRGVFTELQQDAALALDAEIASLNKSARRGLGPLLNRLAGKIKPAMENLPEEARPALTGKFKVEGKCVRPSDGWQISFHKNEDENSEPGDVVVIAKLTLPDRPQLGGGMTTLNIKTLFRAGATQSTRETGRETDAPAPATPPRSKPARITAENPKPGRPSAGTLLDDLLANKTTDPSPAALAVLRYRDNDGDHAFEMTRPSIVVGRGGAGVWTDLKLNTLPDVSREHLRIKYEAAGREADGAFYLKDLSSLGVTIDGRRVPPSMETVGDSRVDKDVWAPLPRRARIGLADVLFLEFDAQ